MKRRDFILSAAAGAGVISVTTWYFFRDVEYDNSIAQPKSLSMIWDNEQIKKIGKQYLIQTPAESSKHTLVKLLNEAGPDLNNRVTNDFQTGRTLLVDGWILSETEARQCALASMTQSN